MSLSKNYSKCHPP